MFPPDSRPTVRQAFSTFMIGTLTNNFMPGRLGDVARAGMIGRLVPAIGASGALATVVLEKVVDGLMLLALLGVALLIAPLPAWLGKTGAIGSLVFLGLLLILLIINAHGKAHRIGSDFKAERFCFGKMVAAMQRLLQRFALGLNALNSKRQALVVLIADFGYLALGVLHYVRCFSDVWPELALCGSNGYRSDIVHWNDAAGSAWGHRHIPIFHSHRFATLSCAGEPGIGFGSIFKPICFRQQHACWVCLLFQLKE